uniref:Uncharacterized protein n=1 Tax=Shewanella putrefaciens (strain 200) TaxID=399804 RepID=E6XLU6_SHEP2
MTELTHSLLNQELYSPCGNSEGRRIPWSFVSLDSHPSVKNKRKK